MTTIINPTIPTIVHRTTWSGGLKFPVEGGYHLILVGHSGSGKTDLGHLIASWLNIGWIDTDREIERRTGKDCLTLLGEDHAKFREVESEILSEVLVCREQAVISTGGGTILSQNNRTMMRTMGVVIWLHASIATLSTRRDPDEVVQAYFERLPLYEATRHKVLCVDGLSRLGAVKDLVNLLD